MNSLSRNKEQKSMDSASGKSQCLSTEPDINETGHATGNNQVTGVLENLNTETGVMVTGSEPVSTTELKELILRMEY